MEDLEIEEEAGQEDEEAAATKNDAMTIFRGHSGVCGL